MRRLRWITLMSLSVAMFWTGQSTAQQPAADQPMHMKVLVPADAQVWLNGASTTAQGPVREFVSPPLKPGKLFVYDVRVRWQRYGQTIDQTREVTVQAGNYIKLDFGGPAGGYSASPVITYGERAYYTPPPEALSYFSSVPYSGGLRNTNRIGWASRQSGILSYYGATPGWGTVDSSGLR